MSIKPFQSVPARIHVAILAGAILATAWSASKGSQVSQAERAKASADARVAAPNSQYLQFVLTNLAGLDHDAESVSMIEKILVKRFGFNDQEVTAARAAAADVRTLLAGIRQRSQASATPPFSNLVLQRARLLLSQAQKVLSGLRP